MRTKPADAGRVAVLTALATILQVLESFFPHPVPGVRLGLANMITIVALVREGWPVAIEISVLRSIIGSFMLGTFMSPSFFLSVTSALASTAIMALAHALVTRSKKPVLSLVGISLAGAFAHAMTQLCLVYFLFVRHPGVLMLAPVIGVSAVITGWVNGIVAAGVCSRLSAGPAATVEAAKTGSVLRSMPGANVRSTSLPHAGKNTLPAEVSVCIMVLLAIAVVLFDNFYFYAALALAILEVCVLMRIKTRNLLGPIWNMRFFAAFAFLVPALFTEGGKIFFSFSVIRISSEGLLYGGLFASRIVVLMLASTLLTLAYTPERLALGIRTLLSPLSFLRIDTAGIGEALARAWSLVPVLLKESEGFLAKKFARKNDDGKRRIIDNISDFIAALYDKYATPNGRTKGSGHYHYYRR